MQSSDRNKLRETAELCLKSARIMMASGAETSRVEDIVVRISHTLKVPIETHATPTGIIISAGGERPVTRICRVKDRTIDLDKVCKVNAMSRRLAAKEITIAQANRELDEMVSGKPLYSQLVIYLAQGAYCAGFSMLLGGGIPELVPAFLMGLVSKYAENKCAGQPPFLIVFINAFCVTLSAMIYSSLYPEAKIEAVIIAGLIPLLPGLSLTNAVVDLMGGELLAGMARTTDSLLTAAALAAGAAAGLGLGNML